MPTSQLTRKKGEPFRYEMVPTPEEMAIEQHKAMCERMDRLEEKLDRLIQLLETRSKRP